MTVFVDTSALYALLDSDDANHARARKQWAALLETQEPLLTTSYVVVETAALVQHRLGTEASRALFDELLGVVEVIFVGPDTHRAATAAWLVADRRKLSLVDCVSFQTMREAGVTTAFAFDRHFVEQGFPSAPASRGPR